MSNARLNNAQELAKRLRKIEKFYIPTSTPVLDPTTAPIVAADDDISVTTLASFTTGDNIIVTGTGRMELNRLGTVPGSGAIPVIRPFSLAQDTGAIVAKATRKDLGYIEDAGGTFASSSSKSGVGAANAGGAIAYLDGDTPEQQFSWAVRESSLRNVLSAYGIDEDAIAGTGTDSDPYRGLISADNIGTQANFCLRASGLLVSNRILYFDLWNCTPEVSVSAQFIGKGQPTTWNMSVKYTDMLIYTLAAAI